MLTRDVYHVTVRNTAGSFDFRLFDHIQVCDENEILVALWGLHYEVCNDKAAQTNSWEIKF